MKWTLTVDAANARVAVTTSGTMRLGDLQRMATEALAAAATAGVRRFLIDHRQTVPAMQTIDVHDLVDVLVAMGADAEHRVATLVAPDAAGLDTYDFFQTRARNRGAHQFRQFTDRDQAIAWLDAAP